MTQNSIDTSNTPPPFWQIKIELGYLDAQKAVDLLEVNHKQNRLIRPNVVNRYVNDMVNGRWILTSESIKFSPDGFMFDGQQRCHAIIIAAETIPDLKIPMVFAYNVDPGAFTVVDSGVKRQPSDALKIAGHIGNLPERAALAKRCILFEYGRRALFSTKGKGLDIKHQITNAEIVAYIEANDALLSTAVELTANLYRMQEKPVLTPTDWSFCFWILSMQMGEVADQKKHNKRVFLFLSELAERCNAQLVELYNSLPGMKSTEKLAAIIEAFKAFPK